LPSQSVTTLIDARGYRLAPNKNGHGGCSTTMNVCALKKWCSPMPLTPSWEPPGHGVSPPTHLVVVWRLWVQWCDERTTIRLLSPRRNVARSIRHSVQGDDGYDQCQEDQVHCHEAQRRKK